MLIAKMQHIYYNDKQELQLKSSFPEHTHKTNRKNETLKEQKEHFSTQGCPLSSIHLRKQSYSHLILFLHTLEKL